MTPWWLACRSPDPAVVADTDEPAADAATWELPPPVWAVAMPNVFDQATCPATAEGDVLMSSAFGLARLAAADGQVVWWDPYPPYDTIFQFDTGMSLHGDRIVSATGSGWVLSHRLDGTLEESVEFDTNQHEIGTCPEAAYFIHAEENTAPTNEFLVARNAALDEVWSHPTGADDVMSLAFQIGGCGDPLLFAAYEPKNASYRLVALERQTGSELWRSDWLFSGSGLESRSEDGQRVVIADEAGLAAVWTTDGTRAWHFPASWGWTFGLGADPTGVVLALQSERGGPITLTKLEWDRGEVIWEAAGPADLDTLGSAPGTMAPDGRTMLFTHSDGYFAIDVGSGEVLATYWTTGPDSRDHDLDTVVPCPLLFLDEGVVAVTRWGVVMMPYIGPLGPAGQKD